MIKVRQFNGIFLVVKFGITSKKRKNRVYTDPSKIYLAEVA